MAILAVAGSAFAAPGGIVANASFPTGSPTTTNNDDSCDISVAPAATLLLPYFEVDIANAAGETTLFTITNVSQLPQIAHVTIWTDWSFPVLDFNIFLTGYDVQSINLFDIISRGRIAEPGTSSDSDTGRRSADNDANPLLDLNNCDLLAVVVPPELLVDLQRALTTGQYSGCSASTRVGATHTNAIGYVTVDLSDSCSTALPTDPGYFTSRLLYDNVLIGDYQQVNSTENFAQGNPMVHLRAIPEGGNASGTVPPDAGPGALPVNFDRTFYSRYQAGGVADRRQPLPSTFAARWISGGATGFETYYKIWREGRTTGATCSVSGLGNQTIPITELVRFDEEENPTTFTPDRIISPRPTVPLSLPESSRTNVTNPIFPPNPDGAVAGWMYLNLDDAASPNTPLGIATQNWVIISMRADGRYSVDFDAAWLGNGCSPAVAVTDEDPFTAPVTGPNIGPAANITPNI
jgi:hypothetical protein